ncbi:YjjW family glycine radical enzyme activase [Marinobacter hydrocarbonoclasticus]|nr:YjjW family glycine radical enzyme activase [Marinobacter nauticus]
MKKPPALSAAVNRILPFSCVDGPGSRMVVFFQGCNMNCPSCHNPQTIGHCNHCLECVPHCPNGALQDASVNGKRRLAHNAGQCQRCESCLPHCRRDGSPYARRYDVETLFNTIREHAMLLDGITFSGGEATLQHRFITALQSRLKSDAETAYLNLLIDSNGLLDSPHWPPLLASSDGVMLDIKAMGAERHKALTGRDNSKVLASAQLLAEAGKLVEVRFLVIEGQNDMADELDGLAAFLSGLPNPPVLKLNGFRHHGVRPSAQAWPQTSEACMERVAAHFTGLGLKVLINSAP